MMWVAFPCSLEMLLGFSCLPTGLVATTSENNDLDFSSAVQTSCNFLSKGNSIQDEIGKGSLGDAISQTLGGCGCNAELIADNPLQHPYPVSHAGMLANIYWCPLHPAMCSIFHMCFLTEGLKQSQWQCEMEAVGGRERVLILYFIRKLKPREGTDQWSYSWSNSGARVQILISDKKIWFLKWTQYWPSNLFFLWYKCWLWLREPKLVYFLMQFHCRYHF